MQKDDGSVIVKRQNETTAKEERRSMSAVFRYTHPKQKWFVDAPAEAAGLLESSSNIAVFDENDVGEPPERCVEMHGRVIKQKGTWIVVSCHGLFVSASLGRKKTFSTGSPVRVIIS